MDVTYDRYSLLINGKREFIRSGAMHYFRLPSEALWRDRLLKLKSAGYNAVDLYFCWGYHSQEPGNYDFTGVRDVRRLLEIVEEVGLYLIARPGPYINAEYSGGGFPGWLLARDDVTLRNRDKNGALAWSETYMKYVREWWQQIVPMIADCPQLILMQIENEYATLEVEPDYLKALYDMTRELGIQVPLFHNDLYAAGLYQDVVDIYAFDNYSVTSFDTNWRELTGVFSVLDHVEENFRPFCENRPLFVAELQAGWFGKWRGEKYEKIVEHLGREHISVSTKSLIGQGLTLFNHYKAIGGTNWGFTGSTATYTSYDFAAPISESGLNKESLFEAKAINQFLASFDLAATDNEDVTAVEVDDPEHLYKVRRHAKRADEHWIFLRNLKSKAADVVLNGTLPVKLKAHECLILPQSVKLDSGASVAHSSVELLHQDSTRLLLKANRAGEVKLTGKALAGEVLSAPDGVAVEVDGGGDAVTIRFDELTAEQVFHVQIGALNVFGLGQIYADHCWAEGGRFVLGPELRLESTLYGVSNPLTRTYVIEGDGTLTRRENPHEIEIPKLPKLTGWEAQNRSPALTKNLQFFRTSPRGTDFDSNGFYEGSAWYRYHLPADAHRVTIDARHIWAAYLNGEYLGQGAHLTVGEVEVPVEPTTLDIPRQKILDDETNELVIFVDGLGHPKGFHDDGRTPQGLLVLEVDGKDAREKVCYSVGFAAYSPKEHPPKTAPVVSLRTTFKLDLPDQLYSPMGLQIEGLDVTRVNIYLNGQLIGRHWRDCNAQSCYYLPEGVLYANGEQDNVLELILMNFDPVLDTRSCAPKPEQVYLKPYRVFTKTLQ